MRLDSTVERSDMIHPSLKLNHFLSLNNAGRWNHSVQMARRIPFVFSEASANVKRSRKIDDVTTSTLITIKLFLTMNRFSTLALLSLLTSANAFTMAPPSVRTVRVFKLEIQSTRFTMILVFLTGLMSRFSLYFRHRLLVLLSLTL